MFIGSIFFIVIVVYISVRLSSKFSGIVKFFVFSIALLIFSVGGVLAVAYPLAVLSDVKLESKRARNDKDVLISTNNQDTKPLTATTLVTTVSYPHKTKK